MIGSLPLCCSPSSRLYTTKSLKQSVPCDDAYPLFQLTLTCIYIAPTFLLQTIPSIYGAQFRWVFHRRFWLVDSLSFVTNLSRLSIVITLTRCTFSRRDALDASRHLAPKIPKTARGRTALCMQGSLNASLLNRGQCDYMPALTERGHV